MILAIDFDEVCHDQQNPLPGRRMGPPLPGAKDALDAYHAQGHTIIIHTVRAARPDGWRHVQSWLNFHAVPFDDITAVKPNADVFLDDKAVRFTSWHQARIVLDHLIGSPNGDQ